MELFDRMKYICISIASYSNFLTCFLVCTYNIYAYMRTYARTYMLTNIDMYTCEHIKENLCFFDRYHLCISSSGPVIDSLDIQHLDRQYKPYVLEIVLPLHICQIVSHVI